MTTNTPEFIDHQDDGLEAVQPSTFASIGTVASRLMLAAATLMYAADADAQQPVRSGVQPGGQTRPGANQPKVSAPQPTKPTTPAFRPTLGQPKPPAAPSTGKGQLAPTTKPTTAPQAKPGANVPAKVDPSKATLGTAKVAPRRSSAATLSTIKEGGQAFYGTIVSELDEIYETQKADVDMIEQGFQRLIETRDPQEAAELYGVLSWLLTDSPDGKTSSKLNRIAIPQVVRELSQILDSKR